MPPNDVTPLRLAIDAVEQARRGADVGDLLLESARALRASGDFSADRFAAERAVRRALLAGSRRDGVEDVVEAAAERGRNGPLEVVSLCFRDGDPLHEPWPDNPWRIPAAATVPEALEVVWGAVRGDAARFLRIAKKHVVGLAYLHDKRGDAALGYLTSSAAPQDRRSATAWATDRDVKLLIGCAPNPEPQVDAGIVVPAPLRALYQAHGGLYEPGIGCWSLALPADLLLWSSMLGHTEPTPVDAEDEDETVDSDELLSFFSHGDDRSDLFELDGDEDPPVRSWGDGMLYRAPDDREGFWAWFERNAGRLLGVG